jgi:hypothetical protein
MRRLLPPLFIALTLSIATRAEAVTLQEIIDLTRAGVADEVLLALIEVDQRVFPVDPETLSNLKQAGVSPAVMVAIVKSGRAQRPLPEPADVVTAEPPPPDPQVVVIERERPVIQEVAVPVPVYVAVGSSRFHSRVRYTGVPYGSVSTPYPPTGTVLPPPPYGSAPTLSEPASGRRQKAAEPVYWGWGGKRRPDSWKTSPNQK